MGQLNCKNCHDGSKKPALLVASWGNHDDDDRSGGEGGGGGGFDLPADVHSSSKGNNGRRRLSATSSPSRVRRNCGRSDCSSNSNSRIRREADASLLHGESISLTGEEFSDTAAVAQDESPSAKNIRPSVSENEVPDEYVNRGGRSSPPFFRINSQNFARLPEFVAVEGRWIPPLRVNKQHHPAKIPVDASKCPDECITCVGRTSPPLETGTQHTTMDERSFDTQNSPKKKKKRRSAAMKSFKKLVTRKSKSSLTVMAMYPSFDESDSPTNPPTGDFSHLYRSDSEGLPNTPQQIVGGTLSSDRLASLKSKIGNIRSNIHSLEVDLIATRNELARAHQHLHLASIELADMQREALEAEITLSNFVHRHGSISASTSDSDLSCSGYFTPNSSTTESGEDSECSTPQSQPLYDSSLSLEDKDNTSTTHEAATRKSRGENDENLLTRNGRPELGSSSEFDRRGKISNALTCGVDSNKESTSTSPPSDASTSQEIIPMAQMDGAKTKKTANSKQTSPMAILQREESFIRAHDLALTDDTSLLLPLQETGVNNVLDALFEKGFEFAMDESERWSQESSTGKILSKHAKMILNGEVDGPMGQWPNAAYGDDILVWTCKCRQDGYGSQYPVVKARGIIPTSACKLVELLLDSGKVQQYNKMSLGRIDEHCFAEGVDRLGKCSETGIQGEAKIIRSKSQPPVIPKPVELRLLLHARRLRSGSEGEGARYLIVGRSIWETVHGTVDVTNTSVKRCEMLLSVNLIRDIKVSGCCEITTINHGVSPDIPFFIGKRIGLAAAAKYVRDVRAVFEKHE